MAGILEDPLNHNLVTDIRADQIWLTAATTIGESDVTGLNALDIGSGPLGWVDLSAPDGINVYSPSTQVNLRDISVSNGDFSMTSFANSIGVVGTLSASGNVRLQAAEAILVDSNSRIESVNGNVDIMSSGYRQVTSFDPLVPADPTQYGLKMDAGASIQAVIGEVSINTAFDLYAGGASIIAGGAMQLDSAGITLTHVTSGGSANVNAGSGGITLNGLFQAANDIVFDSVGDILGSGNDLHLIGGNLTLTSSAGSVGSPVQTLVGDSNGKVNIAANDGVYYEERQVPCCLTALPR